MRILLINPPCGPRTIGLKHLARIEPLGLELVGAGVSRDHEVLLVDMEVAPGDLAAALRKFTPDVAGVTAQIVHRDTALDALRAVRQAAPHCLTVVGGHHATLCPEDFDDDAVDLIVLGEGVETFAEICAARAGGAERFDKIRGLVQRTPDGLRPTAPRPLPRNLDHQPLPDRGLTARYRDQYFYLFEDRVAAIRTSVGCTFPCIFCSCRIYAKNSFIPRSPELVFDEIRSLKEEFVMFCDDHSFLDPERMRVLGEMLLRGGVRKRYFAYARADSIVENRDVFALWAKAGLWLVMTGLEALDEQALRRAGKKSSAQTNQEAVRILEELGINLSAGFLIEPHFRKRDFKVLDDYVRRHPAILLCELTPLTPLPGTPLHRKVKDRILTQDRQVYDLQHFIMDTDLPPRELYRMMRRSYARIVARVIRRLGLWRPDILLSRSGRRAIAGLIRSHHALGKAHRHVTPAPAGIGAAAQADPVR